MPLKRGRTLMSLTAHKHSYETMFIKTSFALMLTVPTIKEGRIHGGRGEFREIPPNVK